MGGSLNGATPDIYYIPSMEKCRNENFDSPLWNYIISIKFNKEEKQKYIFIDTKYTETSMFTFTRQRDYRGKCAATFSILDLSIFFGFSFSALYCGTRYRKITSRLHRFLHNHSCGFSWSLCTVIFTFDRIHFSASLFFIVFTYRLDNWPYNKFRQMENWEKSFGKTHFHLFSHLHTYNARELLSVINRNVF